MPLRQQQKKSSYQQVKINQIANTLFQWLANWCATGDVKQPEFVKSWSTREWNIAKAVIIVHGMGPLWGYLLTQYQGSSLFPLSLSEFLQAQFSENSQRLKMMTKERDRFIDALQEQQVNVLPFKGIELANTLYKQSGTRPMADIDLYICLEDREKTLTTVEKLGYKIHVENQDGITCYLKGWSDSKPNNKTSSLDCKWYGAQLETNNIETLMMGESCQLPFSFDIHFSMEQGMRETRFDMDQPFRTACQNNTTLSPEENIVYQLLHTTKHLRSRSARWLQLYDIQLLLKQKNIDWQLVNSIAEKEKISPQLLLPIILTRKLFANTPSLLEGKLAANTPWHMRYLFNKLELSGLSFCNPYATNLWHSIIWIHKVNHLYLWLVLSLKVENTTKIIKNKKILPADSFYRRLIAKFKNFLTKVPRPQWQIFALQDLLPQKDWK